MFLYALVFPAIFLLFDCFEWYLPLVSTCLLYALVLPYIFLLFDCFKWVLIDCIERHRVNSALWQFCMGGSICLWYLHVFSMHWCFLISSYYLTVLNGICLWYLHVFSMHWYFLISSYYLTVSNGHSLTTLKGLEFTQCSGSFEWGGPSAFGIYMFSLCTGISLYLPIIWLFQMGAHWPHWKA